MSYFQPSNLNVPAKKRLLKELEMLREEKDMGIRVELRCNSSGDNLLNEWDLFMEGPPDTIYENYTLHARMNFPSRYPFQPPTFRFITPMFHPNIYNDGVVCISILHTENDDPTETENDKCTWTPGQNIRTVCLSITSLLSEPNIFSPANVDASNMLRDTPEIYNKKIKDMLAMYYEKLNK